METKKKPVASSVIVGVLLAVGIFALTFALSLTNAVRAEIVQNAAKAAESSSGSSQTAGQAVGGAFATALGMSFAIVILAGLGIVFYGGVFVVGIIGFILTLNRFKSQEGKARIYFLIMFIANCVLLAGGIAGTVWLIV